MKTATQQAIEDAIAGGFKDFNFISLMQDPDEVYVEDGMVKVRKSKDGWDSGAAIKMSSVIEHIHELLLEPHFWQAVGKTRGWDGSTGSFKYKRPIKYGDGSVHTVEIERKNKATRLNWKRNMHRFIDHLADGLSINEALAAIK